MDFANATVETTSSLGPQAIWSPVAGDPAILQGRYTITISATANPSLFCRLKLQLTNGSTAPMVRTAKFSSAYTADVFCGPMSPHRNGNNCSRMMMLILAS
jgi:hypothetical protein